MHNPMLWVGLLLFIQMTCVWIVAMRIKNPSIIDVFWPVGLTLSGLLYLLTDTITLREFIFSSILIIWGLRLALFLYFTRIRKNIVDKRYIELSKQWQGSIKVGFFLNFQLQAVLIFVISIPFYFSTLSTHDYLSLADKIGLILAMIGIIGETTADIQLQNFKSKRLGKVCNVGLWNYSRHPNYFFDWLTWVGFSLTGLSVNYGWIGLISPITLYLIMTQVTGPMTEQGSIQSKGQAYLEYQKKTAMFFPWLK
jgi:steroid 5-alpha reductase family enzyme